MGFPPLALGILVAYTAATGPAFTDMATDLKAGWILRGRGVNREFELAGRKQQFISEMVGYLVAFVMVALMAKTYFSQDLFVPTARTYIATIEAGANFEIAKWLVIWAIPGAIIQILGGHRQLGILFATGLLIGNIKWPYSICSPGHPCSCIKVEKETGTGSSVYSGCRMYCRICSLQLLLLHFKACRCEKEIINHRGLYQPGADAK